MIQPPTLKETKFLLPKPALMQNDVNPQQLVQMVQNNWPQIEPLHSVEAKAQFLGLYEYLEYFRFYLSESLSKH
jgi:myosin-15